MKPTILGGSWERGEWGAIGRGWASVIAQQRDGKRQESPQSRNLHHLSIQSQPWPSQFAILHADSGQARLSAHPRSPVPSQTTSLSSLQNVGTVTLDRIVFSKLTDPPKRS